MILTVDIGNTNMVLSCCEGQKILFTERLSTAPAQTTSEYAIIIKLILDLNRIDAAALKGAILSSVVPPLTNQICDAIYKVIGIRPLVVGPGLKTGLNIAIDNPAEVGSDLVVTAVASLAEHEAPLIILDLGTASTISVIDQNRNYIGGMIMPGIKGSLNSLVSETSQLPSISLEAPKRLIGRNTDEAMKSGLIYGNASCVDGMIDRIEEELKQKTSVIATGGLAGVIIPHCRHQIFLDEDLLTKGLLILYAKNQ